MSTNTTKLFVEFDSKELVFVVSILDEKKFKILHSINLPLNGVDDNKITNLKLITDVIRQNLYSIEQKYKTTFREVVLLINNFNCTLCNVSGYKKLNGSQLSKENVTYILNSVKSKIDETTLNKKIIHILNSKYLLDKKNTNNLPIGLFGNFYSQELSFFLIDINDYKNIQNIFEKCNLKIRKIISKNFIEGISLININQNIETFFTLKMSQENSQIFFFENSSLKFIQNFNFGTEIIINDISKVIALEKKIIKNFLKNCDFSNKFSEEDFLEKDYFIKNNFRKIRKRLLFEIADSRIREIIEVMLLKNSNTISFLNNNVKIFINLEDQLTKNIFENSLSFFLSKRNLTFSFYEKIPLSDLYENTDKLVQFGWKREAVPVIQEKKSFIAKFFEFLFH